MILKVSVGDILISKRTGRRYVATSYKVSKSMAGADTVSVIPEEDFKDYQAAIILDGWFGRVYEGIRPWKMPCRELDRTDEVYSSSDDNEDTIDHWSTMQWADDGGNYV